MIRRLLYPEWCYVVRSDHRVVTVPHASAVERFAHGLLWDALLAAVGQMYRRAWTFHGAEEPKP